MKAVFLFSFVLVVLGAEAWPLDVKNPFELMTAPVEVYTLTDCMHVVLEDSDFIFEKNPPTQRFSSEESDPNLLDTSNSMAVCGLYALGEPNTVVELTIKNLNVNCETGGLLAFVDGWELNGQYFPGELEHEKKLNERVVEFCNDYNQLPLVTHKKSFRSSQNAALLQYRVPVRGSFFISVRFHRIKEPCNIMVQDIPGVYNLRNYGHHRNCTLTAVFPSVVSVMDLNVGPKNNFHDQNSEDYQCFASDRLEIGGSPGLDAHNMLMASRICGHTKQEFSEKAIFCEATSIRLVSSGKYENFASLYIRQASDTDLKKPSLICPL